MEAGMEVGAMVEAIVVKLPAAAVVGWGYVGTVNLSQNVRHANGAVTICGRTLVVVSNGS
jgi:hypothetical protein